VGGHATRVAEPAAVRAAAGAHAAGAATAPGMAARRGRGMFGTIKRIVKDKGFGFIVPDDGSDEVFFHRTKMAPKVYFEDLREGEEVEFQVHKGDKGPQAFNLKPR
jgi:CspA family cold shock protein